MPCSYQYDFFVSYPSAPDENIVVDFIKALVRTLNYLYTGDRQSELAYVDRYQLAPGVRWNAEISRALCRSRALLCIYTEEYFSHEYCVREFAAMEELEVRRIGRSTRSMILPVLLRAPEDLRGRPILPERLQGFHYLDLRSISSPALQFKNVGVRNKVERLLQRLVDLRRQSADPIVDCESYDALSLPAPVLPAPAEAFGGSWASST